jgi:hypothetical protein
MIPAALDRWMVRGIIPYEVFDRGLPYRHPGTFHDWFELR